MKRKITAAVLALCLVLGLLPLSTLAAQYTAALNDKQITIDVDDETGAVSLPGGLTDYYSVAPETLTAGSFPATQDFTLTTKHYDAAPATITVHGTRVNSTADAAIALGAGTVAGSTPAANLGEFEIEKTGSGYKITGTAKYVTLTGQPDGEGEGHYLYITVSSDAGAVTLTNNSSAAKEGQTLSLANGTVNALVWLDGSLMEAYESTNLGKTFKINHVVVDFSDVVLEAKVETTATSVTVNAGSEVIDLLDPAGGDQTAVNETAPVVVEGTGSGKTLTFTGKDGESAAPKQDNTVKLDGALVDAVTAPGNNITAAAVKVESGSGSVSVPMSVLNTSAVKTDGAEIAVRKDTVADADVPAGADAAVKAAITGAPAAVEVTAKTKADGTGANLLEPKASYTAADPAVTIEISGLTAGRTYVVLCISNGALTSFGRFANLTGTSLSFGSKHLSTFIAAQETSSNAAALAAVAADPGAAAPAAEKTAHVTYTAYGTGDAGYAQWGSGKLAVTGLEANKWYTVQLGSSNTAYQIYQVVQANAGGEIELRVQTGLQMTLFYLGDDADTFSAQMAKGPVLLPKAAITLSTCTGAGKDFAVDTSISG